MLKKLRKKTDVRDFDRRCRRVGHRREARRRVATELERETRRVRRGRGPGTQVAQRAQEPAVCRLVRVQGRAVRVVARERRVARLEVRGRDFRQPLFQRSGRRRHLSKMVFSL